MVDTKNHPDRLAKQLGMHISARRKALKWTQDAVAERVGVDAETISRFERGANLPSLPTLERLAKALRIDIGELLSKPVTKNIDDISLIATWMADLSSEDRQFVLSTVRNCCEHLRKKI